MLIPEGWAQVNMKFDGVGLPTGAQITYGIRVENFVGEPADAAQAISVNWLASNIDSVMSSSVTLRNILVKYGPNSTGPAAEISVAQPGTGSSDVETPNTAYLVRKLTLFGGRTGRGRFYLPGCPTAAVTGPGNVDGTTLGNLQTALDAFLTSMTGDDLPLALLHAPDSPFNLPMLITELKPDVKVATQRRRLRR